MNLNVCIYISCAIIALYISHWSNSFNPSSSTSRKDFHLFFINFQSFLILESAVKKVSRWKASLKMEILKLFLIIDFILPTTVRLS